LSTSGLALLLTAAVSGFVATGASAEPKLCTIRMAIVVGGQRASLPCRVSAGKEIIIGNNSGQAINLAQVPISYEAINSHDQKHWCETLKSGTVAAGGTVHLGVNTPEARPLGSCTASYRKPALLSQ